MINPTELMQMAIDKAREGIAAGQTPFGSAIANERGVIAVAHNTVLFATDITAHAEMNAIRQACHLKGDILLQDCIVASTCEPCPMCMSALHWARVTVVYYGARISDAGAAGFNELRLPAAELVRVGGSTVKLAGGLLAKECQQLFRQWQGLSQRRVY